MSNSIVGLVEKEMVMFRSLRRDHPLLFPQNDRLYPIPFFGDVRRAEVVTIALNPAHPEFSEGRRWPINNESTALTPLALTNRLLCYFHSQTPPHNFFDGCEMALRAIGCSYQDNAAHIDVHPFPTEFNGNLNPCEAAILRETIQEHSTQHLNSVLQLFGRLKLVIAIDFAVPIAQGQWMITYEYVRRRLGSLSGLVDRECLQPPLIRGGGLSGLVQLLAERRDELQSFLRTAPCLLFSP